MEILNTINQIIALLFFICYLHQLIYIPIRLFRKRKSAFQTTLHRFAVLICARNEEDVIAQLIESIQRQSYPKEYIHIFVMADNCTDRTAAVARLAGVTVYERQNKTLVGKGYALDALLHNIARDHGDIYDGYFVFDADNLLAKDYIEQMNRCFQNGSEDSPAGECHEILTSYRNAKNFGDNWISAGYSIGFLREAAYLNDPRSVMGIASAISGTGFLFSRRILHEMGGWPYHLLTEDIEFGTDQILRGEHIGYCREAIFFDEQPTRFSQSWHQRMRWVKGYLQVFSRYAGRLFKGLLRGNFSCYDTCMSNIPAVALNVVSMVVNVCISCVRLELNMPLPVALAPIGTSLLYAYLTFFLFGVFTVITEWKHIHTTAAKKLRYLFTFPLFMFTYIPISIAALFLPVTWKPIKHHARPVTAVGKQTD